MEFVVDDYYGILEKKALKYAIASVSHIYNHPQTISFYIVDSDAL